MAAFLRSKQAGIQNDLSGSIGPELFTPDEQARYGINSQISCLGYDPVQSLLAVGTSESKFGPGIIYLFGQGRVHKRLEPPRATSFQAVQFSANRIVSLDTKNELGVWDADKGSRVAAQVIAGQVAVLTTDPMLDWAFLGLRNGEVLAYDLDRGSLARDFRLPNFYRDRDHPEARAATLVCLSMHPRDVGKMVIGYTHGAVIYSFKQNRPVHFLEYTLRPGAPGGNGAGIDSVRHPRLTHAVWHPSGTFIVTAHEDGSLVLWDTKEGKMITARTVKDVGVDRPAPNVAHPTSTEPLIKIAWCCKENCDDTGLLIAGGQSVGAGPKSMTFIELGLTPMYATSSWQALTDYFGGKRQLSLPLPQGAQVVDFLPIPRASPHFAGAQDPLAIICLLSSGELATMSFPSGHLISPTNQLHPSTFFVHPFVTKMTVSSLERPRWLSMMEKRDQGEPLLKGGMEGRRPRKRFEQRTVIQAAHCDGTIRIWDSGHDDDVENSQVLQVDMARALDRDDDVDVTAMRMAGNTGEFVAGTRTGEAVVFRWGRNASYGRNEARQLDPNPKGLTDVSSRSEPSLKEGLQPFVLYEMMQGPITAVQVSDVGFVAVGSELGFLTIMDLRGPRIVYQAPMTDFAKQEKRTSLLRSHLSSHHHHDQQAGERGPPKEWPVVIEFGAMTLDEDRYSSICCFVGTNLGKVITLKLLPGSNGSYTAQVAGFVAFEGRVISLSPIVAETGKPALATGATVAGLREGRRINGALVAVTQNEIRIFRPANSRGAAKEFGDVICDAASVAELELQGSAVVALFGDRTARAYSMPALKELGQARMPMLDAERGPSAIVTSTGDIFGWTGPSELTMVHVWGSGKELRPSPDTLINPDLECWPRPTISNLQWISGTQHVSPLDLDLLVGGPDRPPSKRMLEAASAQQRAATAATAAAAGGGGGAAAGAGAGFAAAGGGGAAGGSQESWGEYFTRQLNERTEKLNIMGDSMETLQQQSQGWAEDVNKFMNKQKRNVIMGGLKSKFF